MTEKNRDSFSDAQLSPDQKWRPALQLPGIDSNYTHAIGHLFLCMSVAEERLLDLLRALVSVDQEMFDIISKELKSNQVQRFIKEALENSHHSGRETEALIIKKMKRLSFIREKRNQIAHWAASHDGNALSLKKTRGSNEKIEMSLEDIRKWADELSELTMYFFAFSLPEEEQRSLADALLQATSETRRSSTQLDADA